MDSIVQRHVTVLQKHPMVAIVKRANVVVNLVSMVTDVKNVSQTATNFYKRLFSFRFKACPSGQWGEECINQCDCNGSSCDSQTGTCICSPGRTGLQCEQGRLFFVFQSLKTRVFYLIFKNAQRIHSELVVNPAYAILLNYVTLSQEIVNVRQAGKVMHVNFQKQRTDPVCIE